MTVSTAITIQSHPTKRKPARKGFCKAAFKFDALSAFESLGQAASECSAALANSTTLPIATRIRAALFSPLISGSLQLCMPGFSL